VIYRYRSSTKPNIKVYTRIKNVATEFPRLYSH